MITDTKHMTEYFRAAIASQSNIEIDFKKDNFIRIDPYDLINGELNSDIYNELSGPTDTSKQHIKDPLNVIISAKNIATKYKSSIEIQENIEHLTGIFYIPAILDEDNTLSFPLDENELPWFPREYLMPMLEPKIAVGLIDTVDAFKKANVDLVKNMSSWFEYAGYFCAFYKAVTDTDFLATDIRSLDDKKRLYESDKKAYIFKYTTINATNGIIKLYDYLIEKEPYVPLYKTFLSTNILPTIPLIKNDIRNMEQHCGQMGGEYLLSRSQREAINHVNAMKSGEILAVNGPPGTGKTTLLQTIVADMFVKRALKEESAPVIVASSANNQAVTNIIESFGNISNIGIANLEERWIEGVNSFATFFPSIRKIDESIKNGYQCTSNGGTHFFRELESSENKTKSKITFHEKYVQYFQNNYISLLECQKNLHQELLYFENSKKNLLELSKKVSEYDLHGETIDRYVQKLNLEIADIDVNMGTIRSRISEWDDHYANISVITKYLKPCKHFSKKLQTDFRLFININENSFLNEYMSIDEIKEIYSYRYDKLKKSSSAIIAKRTELVEIMEEYTHEIMLLKEHHLDLFDDKEIQFNLELDYINSLLDKKHRYMEFWLAVHYYECKWLMIDNKSAEIKHNLTQADDLKMFYSRISMITPCLVMTFFILPKQFYTYGINRPLYLFNYIDLLIVDEAGQVSPEIAAPSFSLAKKSVIVGDMYQLEPIWNVSHALDIALSWKAEVIQSIAEFQFLVKTGLNTSYSSVMKIAAKCCKYQKFNERGLFLCEHRRCYNEIISYCNLLVYSGNLQPLRGNGKDDEKLAIRQWPQMGIKQVDTKSSSRKNSSRYNYNEAKLIVNWLIYNYEAIVAAYPNESKKNLIAIITPFNAQVSCIKTEIKKQIPAYTQTISVGTVHSFQGAERRIIIFSTVYGSQDGCYFIDANKNLINVAVSRAKDYFFTFGDINCLSGSKNSASGLLKEYIKDHPVPDLI